jgi:hypothetical protein
MPQVFLNWEISKTILEKVLFFIFSAVFPYLGFCVQKFEKGPLRGEQIFS